MGLFPAVWVASAVVVADIRTAEQDRPWLTDARLRADPAAAAAALLAKMTLQEKITMLHGAPGPYVGNVPANTRLGIPPLTLNDGPQGFRSGGSTCWPSGMTVGWTWDVELAGEWGSAMGAEFFGKGANVQLGPGLCVARVPRNGRNFEYLSGEDPFLGYTLVQPLIQGIQSQNVIANAKHYIMNSQETQRSSIDEIVDERTRFEIYYPPFAGAVEADVGSVMCSYNKINGFWSCENNQTLAIDFKSRIGFKGWVMSDWGATHSTSILDGLDQEMPGGVHMGVALQGAVAVGKVKVSDIDDSVTRILVPLFKYGIFDHAAHWANTSNHGVDVTSPAHSGLARKISAAATVLCKNDGRILPLKLGTRVAIINSQAANPIVNGGGSGRVGPTYVVAPLDAIKVRNSVAPSPPSPPNCTFHNDIDYFHIGDASGQASTATECCLQCSTRSDCTSFTFYDSKCYYHTVQGTVRPKQGAISGTCHKSAANDSHVTYDDGSSPSSSASVAAAADVAIVFVATTSSEGSDRKDLSLDGGQDDLITAVAKAQPNTIVVAVTPGAILMPWSPLVKAVLVVGMPGLEYGNAIAEVLYGDVNPSGRLSLTMPNKENEVGFTPSNWPGVDGKSNYTEKLEVGYRYYDAHAIQFTTGFPFGHGLSYTQFEYSNLQVSGRNISVSLKNSGTVSGAEVVQLYLGFPAVAGEPPQQLKGFSKVALDVGAEVTVTFSMSDKDVSIYDVTSHSWRVINGQFSVGVGASSRDIRLKGAMSV